MSYGLHYYSIEHVNKAKAKRKWSIVKRNHQTLNGNGQSSNAKRQSSNAKRWNCQMFKRETLNARRVRLGHGTKPKNTVHDIYTSTHTS